MTTLLYRLCVIVLLSITCRHVLILSGVAWLNPRLAFDGLTYMVFSFIAIMVLIYAITNHTGRKS